MFVFVVTSIIITPRRTKRVLRIWSPGRSRLARAAAENVAVRRRKRLRRRVALYDRTLRKGHWTFDSRFDAHVIRLDRCPNRPARAPVACPNRPKAQRQRGDDSGTRTRDETGIEIRVRPSGSTRFVQRSACSAFASAPQLAKLRIRQFLLHRPVLYSYTVCNCWSCLRCSLQGVSQPPR